jgi:hypothetical protein
MVYKWAIGWLSEGELLLPMVPLILGRIAKPAYRFIRGSAHVPAVTCSPSK